MAARVSALETVIVVEDEALLAIALRDALLEEGAGEVICHSSAAEAVAALTDVTPTLLVLDVSLDDSEAGYGIAEIALQLFNPPPHVVFSTGSPELLPEKLKNRGRVFAKPYDPVELATFAASL